jgi:hypothetical protein
MEQVTGSATEIPMDMLAVADYRDPLGKRAELQVQVAEVIARMTPEEQGICQLLPSMNPTAAGRSLGIGHKRVCRAIQRIRTLFERCGWEQGENRIAR